MSVEQIVFVAVVIFIALIVIVLDYLKKSKRFSRGSEPLINIDASDKDNISKDYIGDIMRLNELDKAMDKLVREHPVLNNIDDSFLLVSMYISCKDMGENEYCKKGLRKRYSSA